MIQKIIYKKKEYLVTYGNYDMICYSFTKLRYSFFQHNNI